MFHGEKTNETSRLYSSSQIEVKTKENILPRGIFLLKYRTLDNE
jgi:hypothetical protein